MSEPMWLGGDPASYADTMEETHSAECGECGQESEFPAYSEYSHRTVSWYADCIVPNASKALAAFANHQCFICC